MWPGYEVNGKQAHYDVFQEGQEEGEEEREHEGG